MMEQIQPVITQTELLELDAQGLDVEVVDGLILESEITVTHLHQVVIENLYDLLKPYAKTRKLGLVHSDGLRYILIGERKKVTLAYKPDVSFIRVERIPEDYDWNGDFPGAPDLAVEVASPGQTTTMLVGKISDYLRSGTEEGWLVIPWRKELHQYRRDADAPRIFFAEDTFTPEGLFPDLTIQINTLFETGI